MESLSSAVSLLGFLLALGGLLWWLVALVIKRPSRGALGLMGVGVFLFALGIAISDGIVDGLLTLSVLLFAGLFSGSLVWLIVCLVKQKPARKPLLTLGISILFLMLFIVLVPDSEVERTDSSPRPTATGVAATLPTPMPTPAPSPTPTPLPTPSPSPSPTPTPTATPTATPTPTQAPVAVASSQSLTAGEVFARVSPAVAFIETAAGTGSGVLIEGGYVVTNAHVVWPFDSARVVFPDGSEFLEVPLLNWDLLGDLAVLGPVDAGTAPIELVNGEGLAIGAETYLIGYPGEVEGFPQPTITRGLISRLREWESIAITYFQTDAAIAGGQSGGVLVSANGEVIGVSGFSFADSRFGIVASAADIVPRIRKLIAGEDVSGLGARRVPMAGGQTQQEVVLRNFWDQQTYVIYERPGSRIEMEMRGGLLTLVAEFTLLDAIGRKVELDGNAFSGYSTTIRYAAPYFLVVTQSLEDSNDYVLTSSHRLAPLDDPDDGKRIRIGRTVVGNIDFPYDIDFFIVALNTGETIEITVDSTLIDPYLTVDFVGATDDEIASNDDGGGGMFGLNARLIYKAPHSGHYFIAVSDSSRNSPGGYILKVE